MVKHTQTIRRQIADELFECVWPFCEIGGKTVKVMYFWFLFENTFENIEIEIVEKNVL